MRRSLHPRPDRRAEVNRLAAGARTVSRTTTAPAEAVFDVLADGWSYATWVVGASRVRSVDVGWPQPGSRIHHSFGLWPAVIDDVSTVLECDPGRLLRLQARGWPVGEATVEVTLHPLDAGCRVEIREDATAGPGRLVPLPARQVALVPRNVEALRRLCLIAEGRGPTRA